MQDAELDEYNASVLSYMGQHPTAVLVVTLGLAGASTALDRNNQYSEQAKEVGEFASIAAGLWVMGHMDEVTDVFTTLNQADAHVKTLKASIAQTSFSIQQQSIAIQQTQQGIGQLTQRTVALEHQRDQLQRWF